MNSVKINKRGKLLCSKCKMPVGEDTRLYYLPFNGLPTQTLNLWTINKCCGSFSILEFFNN